MLPELPPLKEVVKRYSLTPQRSRGQHFLFDSNITDRIANTAELSENTIVYEVGPGPGGLTRSLLKRGVKKVIACETDPRCVQALEELVEYYPERLSIVHEDALLIHEKTHIPKGASIVSNLPYNISTALLFKWLQEPNQWSSMTLMFQREVANRLTAQPGGKNYGRISVIVQWLCHVKILFSINPASFVPPPKVVSSLISIKPRKEPLVQANRNYLENDNLSSIYPYDLSKTCSDLICQSYFTVYKLNVAIVRCGNLFGPGDFNLNRIIPETIISLINNKRIKIRSSGKLVRDYLYVDDAVNAYYMIMKTLEKYKNKKLLIYNVGSKYNLSVLQLVNLILDLMKKKHLKPIIMNKSKQEINFQKLNDNKIKRDLGWKQKVSLKSGLFKTIKWYQDNYKLFKK